MHDHQNLMSPKTPIAMKTFLSDEPAFAESSKVNLSCVFFYKKGKIAYNQQDLLD